MRIRDREGQEAVEQDVLAPDAARARESHGSSTPRDPDRFRTDFQRDRDRILHCKSFRRLSHKTQVFIAPEGDHYRTRLTHTLEVAQIARTISRALCLNEDLTEAIALAHDLGHTPFGHTGEDGLSWALAEYRGLDPEAPGSKRLYRHNEQSVRVVEVLENDRKGLGLTAEVIDGIAHHTGSTKAKTLEGRVVAIADRIAYVNHDIDDSLRADMITIDQLPASTGEILGATNSERITTMVTDLIETSAPVGDIIMSEPVHRAMMELRAFLFKHVYVSSHAKREEPKAFRLVRSLFSYYIDHLDEIPSEYRVADESPEVMVTDFIAGMTDRFAIRTFESIAIPRNWRSRSDRT